MAPTRIPADVLELKALLAGDWQTRMDALVASGAPLNAVTLSQAAVHTEDDLQAGVTERFVQESPILDRLPLKQIPGASYRYRAEATLPGVEFRAVNAAYTESTGTLSQESEGLVILGGDADVDTFIQATSGGSGIPDELELQTNLKVKAASYKFSDAFFNGDVAVDANSFDGLKKRTTGAQVIPIGTNGGDVVGAGDAAAVNAFLDYLDALLAAARVNGDNGVLYANDLVGARIASAGRRAGIVAQEVFTFTDNVTKRVNTYRGTPIVDPGLKLDGTRILPQTETQGTSVGNTSSIYAVRFGEDEADGGVTGLYNGNHANATQRDGVFAVKVLGEQQAKPAHRVRIEGFVGVAVFSGTAVARGTGLRNA